jgi:GTP-binding protein HflX
MGPASRHPDERGRRDPGAALEEARGAGRGSCPTWRSWAPTCAPAAPASRVCSFGKGKIEELKARIEADEIELVLIDGPVTPVQQRNLEKAWGVKLLDRTGLILEIFADRARTREGRAAGGDGGAQLPAHAAGAGLDPP